MESKLKLSEFWPYQAAVLADLVSQHTMGVIRPFNLNLSQWRVLAAIGDNPGCSSANVVSVTPMDKGIVSRGVSSLTERGLVIKTMDSSDKRKASLHLTGTGAVLYTKISENLITAINQIPLGADKAVILNESLKHYIEAMQVIMQTSKP